MSYIDVLTKKEWKIGKSILWICSRIRKQYTSKIEYRVYDIQEDKMISPQDF